MEIRDWRLLLLPEEGDPVVLSREKAWELLERLEKVEKEKAELEEQWVEYKKRHPETLGGEVREALCTEDPDRASPLGGQAWGLAPATSLDFGLDPTPSIGGSTSR